MQRRLSGMRSVGYDTEVPADRTVCDPTAHCLLPSAFCLLQVARLFDGAFSRALRSFKRLIDCHLAG